MAPRAIVLSVLGTATFGFAFVLSLLFCIQVRLEIHCARMHPVTLSHCGGRATVMRLLSMMAICIHPSACLHASRTQNEGPVLLWCLLLPKTGSCNSALSGHVFYIGFRVYI